jgi:hypothetical protein
MAQWLFVWAIYHRTRTTKIPNGFFREIVLDIRRRVFDTHARVCHTCEPVFDTHERVFDTHARVCHTCERVFDTHARVFDTRTRVFDTCERVLDTHARVFNTRKPVFNTHERVFDTRSPVLTSFHSIKDKNNFSPAPLLLRSSAIFERPTPHN